MLLSEICIYIIRVRGGPFIKRTGWHSEAIIDTSSSSFSWSVSVNTWTQGFVISGHQIFNACTTPAYEPLCSSKRRTVPWNRNSERYTRPIPSLNALIRFDPSLAILFEWNNFVWLMRPRRIVLALWFMCIWIILIKEMEER